MKRLIYLLIILQIAAAQIFTGFGRNKIQYDNFEWYILKTEHFDVYYYPEMQDLAEKGAYQAEQAYQKLSKVFHYDINRRIPLIFYSTQVHFQQTNVTPGFIPEGVGGFFEFLKGRVVIPGDGNINQFFKVIRHELVHVFMHTKLNYNFKQHGRRGLKRPPLWYTEGLAEYYSGDWDHNGEMVMKDAVLNNYLPTLEQMGRIRGTYTMYKAGENILHFIADEYGEEKIIDILNNLWKDDDFDKIVEMTLGEPIKKVSRKWQYAQKKRYYPLLKDYDFADAVSESVEQQGFNFKPVYHKPTNEVIFWSNRTGYTGIYRKSLDKLDNVDDEDDLEVILTGEQTGDFESFNVFANRFDVSDGGKIAFSSKTQGRYVLYIYDLNSNRLEQTIKITDRIVGITSPNWSPDQQKIVFSGLNMTGYRDIFVYHMKRDSLQQITNDIHDDNDPIWVNDQEIVFSSDRTKYGQKWSYNLFRMDINSNVTRYLTAGEQQDLVPSLSPDGKWILFVSTRDKEKNMYAIPTDNDRQNKLPVKLSNFTSSVFDANWISDDEIVFTALQRSRFIMQRVDGIAAKLLSDSIPVKQTLSTIHNTGWTPPNLRDYDKFSREKYESEYAIDIATTQVSQDPVFGTTGGAVISLSDVLGDDRYNIVILNSTGSTEEILDQFSFKLSKYHLGQRTNYGYGIFRYSGQRYNFKTFYFEDETGIDGVLAYPLDQFHRVEAYANVRYSERRESRQTRYSWITYGYLAYIKDNSLWGPTGPIDGARYKVSFGYNRDIVFDNVDYFTFLVDIRQYFRITQRTAYAVRGMTLITQGDETRYYALGGSWDLRGYGFLDLRGDHIFLISQEYRFPLFDFFGFKFASGPAIGSNYINGAVFLDAGNAYRDTFNFDDIRGSFGVSAKVNFLGGLVLRWDVGRKTDFNTIDDTTFSKFFFGWDF